MLGLVDGNNFYASCERVFDASLRGQPVVVLSNNDGCAIARSSECKALGVKMGQPIHEVPTHIRRQLKVRSANFALYGDLSGRVVSVLRDLFPAVEVYSIDESFVSFDGIPADQRERVAGQARERIMKWTGIPCCVGIGSTKTLAKLGNKRAKTTDSGVEEITGDHQLQDFAVGDVWGVGRKWAAKLGAEGILTALDLANTSPDALRARYGVVLARTQLELQGVACGQLEESEPDRKQIVVSRSFGREVVELDDVAQAVATFAIRASEKLRARSLSAGGVWVWLDTNPFKSGAKQYHPSRAMQLITPSADTREVLAMAQALVRSMYRKGYAYKKAGVGLLDLSPCGTQQSDLFASVDPRSTKLMAVLDQTNRRFGRGSMGFASAHRPKPGQWAMRQEHLSPSYTTKWDQLLKVR
ncbi:Y-family DNA polymerase [Lysobacter sp. A03]|uniref:Y-family DNA polymerase n=1 Tax=Lysobacter sp. A03 TaxID=1199154 RepID=UPI0005B74A0D|nr:Y-family DNA polymerase [Lysobacter sp. A03]KIQ97341.1 Error-prone, lesion bypass DNA polymerase V (UmuC) [Lysobacter sp. A03]